MLGDGFTGSPVRSLLTVVLPPRGDCVRLQNQPTPTKDSNYTCLALWANSIQHSLVRRIDQDAGFGSCQLYTACCLVH